MIKKGMAQEIRIGLTAVAEPNVDRLIIVAEKCLDTALGSMSDLYADAS